MATRRRRSLLKPAGAPKVAPVGANEAAPEPAAPETQAEAAPDAAETVIAPAPGLEPRAKREPEPEPEPEALDEDLGPPSPTEEVLVAQLQPFAEPLDEYVDDEPLELDDSTDERARAAREARAVADTVHIEVGPSPARPPEAEAAPEDEGPTDDEDEIPTVELQSAVRLTGAGASELFPGYIDDDPPTSEVKDFRVDPPLYEGSPSPEAAPPFETVVWPGDEVEPRMSVGSAVVIAGGLGLAILFLFLAVLYA